MNAAEGYAYLVGLVPQDDKATDALAAIGALLAESMVEKGRRGHRGFDDSPEAANHALLCGEIFGALSIHLGPGGRSEWATARATVEVELDEKGNYTNRLFITRPSGRYIVTIDREEPDASC